MLRTIGFATVLAFFAAAVFADGRAASASIGAFGHRKATLTEIAVPLKGIRFGSWGENGIVAGPDGAMWFTAVNGDGKAAIYGSAIVRYSMDGTFKIYRLRAQAAPVEIAVGSDGALWFTESTGIGRITTSGKVTEFAVPISYGTPYALTLGRDGNIWFTSFSGIARITPKGEISRVECSDRLCQPYEITVGPDGLLWTTDAFLDGLDRFSYAQQTQPTTTSIVFRGNVQGRLLAGLTTGPDNALWLCDLIEGEIIRYQSSGMLTAYRAPGGQPTPNKITTGSDGALWFTNILSNEVDRIDTKGHFERYPAPEQDTLPNYIASGPNGSLWFTNTDTRELGRIVLP